MKLCVSVLVLSLLLAGCGPVPVYYREGVSIARLDRDRTACEVAALRDAPVATRIRQRPPVFVPGRVVCNRKGKKCRRTPGYWIDGRIYTEDVNADLRARVMGMCMARKGYAEVSLPRCSEGVRQSVAVVHPDGLPHLTPESCVIVGNEGQVRIVTPGVPVSSE